MHYRRNVVKSCYLAGQQSRNCSRNFRVTPPCAERHARLGHARRNKRTLDGLSANGVALAILAANFGRLIMDVKNMHAKWIEQELTVMERASSSSRFSAQTAFPWTSLPQTLRKRVSMPTWRSHKQNLRPPPDAHASNSAGSTLPVAESAQTAFPRWSLPQTLLRST
jgi:hypothetical protein